MSLTAKTVPSNVLSCLTPLSLARSSVTTRSSTSSATSTALRRTTTTRLSLRPRSRWRKSLSRFSLKNSTNSWRKSRLPREEGGSPLAVLLRRPPPTEDCPEGAGYCWLPFFYLQPCLSPVGHPINQGHRTLQPLSCPSPSFMCP